MEDKIPLDCNGEPLEMTLYNVEIENNPCFPWGGEIIRGTVGKVKQYLIDEYGWDCKSAQEVVDHTIDHGAWNNGSPAMTTVICRQTIQEMVEGAWALYASEEKLEDTVEVKDL